MSFDKVRHVIICDIKNCNSTTSPLYPGAHWSGWVWLNGIGKDICFKCKRKLQEEHGDDWVNHLDLKIVY